MAETSMVHLPRLTRTTAVSLQVVYAEINPESLELALPRTNFHDPKSV